MNAACSSRKLSKDGIIVGAAGNPFARSTQITSEHLPFYNLKPYNNVEFALIFRRVPLPEKGHTQAVRVCGDCQGKVSCQWKVGHKKFSNWFLSHRTYNFCRRARNVCAVIKDFQKQFVPITAETVGMPAVQTALLTK